MLRKWVVPLGFNLMPFPSEKADGRALRYFRKLAIVELPCPKAVSRFSENS